MGARISLVESESPLDHIDGVPVLGLQPPIAALPHGAIDLHSDATKEEAVSSGPGNGLYGYDPTSVAPSSVQGSWARERGLVVEWSALACVPEGLPPSERGRFLDPLPFPRAYAETTKM